jgi:hypothetical protein
MCQDVTTPGRFDFASAPADGRRQVRLSRRIGVQRGWRLVERVTQMSPDEVRHRVRRLVWRVAEPIPVPSAPDVLDALCQQAETRFLFGAATRVDVVAALSARCPAAGRAIVAAADGLEAGRLEVFGHAVHLDADRLDWCADPCSQRRLWPAVAMDEARAVRHAQAAAEGPFAPDVKLVWELSRHQFMPTLGAAFWLDGRASRKETALRLVESWTAQNPAGVGVNWASRLEIGLRAIAWLWGMAFLLGTAEVAVERRRRWAASLAAHYEHLRRGLSSYTDPSNHLVGEAAALWMLATTLPALPDADRERGRALETLVREATRQVTVDGVSEEQAIGYHCFVLELYLQVLALARRHGEHVPDVVRGRALAMLDFLGAVSGPRGHVHPIGDADDGRAIPYPWPADERRRTIALLVAGGALLGVSPGVTAEEPPDLPLWLLGADAAASVSPTNGVRAPRSRAFASGGYCVLESAAPGGAWRQMVFDVGGFGAIPNGAHAHADALGVLVRVGETAILGDPGTGTYGASRVVRDAFRGTAAHNTLAVDGLDQADTLDTFKWLNLPRVTLERWMTAEHCDFAEASHDGYLRLRRPVRHTRAVLFVRPDYWIVVDRLRGRGHHRVCRWFHFPPDVRVTACADGGFEARAGATADGLRLVFLPCADELRSDARVTRAPWSPGYGRWTTSEALAVETTGTVPMTLVTVLVVLDAQAPRVSVVGGPTLQRAVASAATLCRVAAEGVFEDTVAVGGDGAEFEVVRRAADGATQWTFVSPRAARERHG